MLEFGRLLLNGCSTIKLTHMVGFKLTLDAISANRKCATLSTTLQYNVV